MGCSRRFVNFDMHMVPTWQLNACLCVCFYASTYLLLRLYETFPNIRWAITISSQYFRWMQQVDYRRSCFTWHMIAVYLQLMVVGLGLGAWKEFCGTFLCLERSGQFWEAVSAFCCLEVLPLQWYSKIHQYLSWVSVPETFKYFQYRSCWFLPVYNTNHSLSHTQHIGIELHISQT